MEFDLYKYNTVNTLLINKTLLTTHKGPTRVVYIQKHSTPHLPLKKSIVCRS